MSTPSPVPSDLQNPAQPLAPSASIGDLSLPLAQGKGWMKFVGIMSIIYGAVMSLAVIGYVIVHSIGYPDDDGIPDIIGGTIVIIVYATFGGLFIWAGRLVLRAAGAINRAHRNSDAQALKESLGKLKKTFVIVGIFYLVSLVLMLVMSVLYVGFIVTMATGF